MSLSTILLIAIAAVVVFIMYRVGRDGREAVRAPGAAHDALPTQTMGATDGHLRDREEPGRVDDRGQTGHGADGEGRPRRRHGRC